jgi:NAD(P)H dehydrogenase (quinone)
VSGAPRADYAAAAAAAVLADLQGDAVHELGGPAFTFDELAATISEVTGRTVVSRDLPVPGYAAALQRAGLDEATAGFVAALDASIAAGDLQADSDDLARLLAAR